MAKKKTISSSVSSYPPIVTIDPFSNSSYRLEKNDFSLNSLSKVARKSDFFTSYISAKEVVSGVLEISGDISENEIHDAIELRAYEELGLDSSVNYKINYVLSGASGQSNKLYSVFAINMDTISKSFSEIGKKIPYIDYLTISPFLIKSLYKKNIIEHSGIECFLYFQKHDAFLAIYSDGEYLYSRSLQYSLSEISEKFCSMSGERLDSEKFYSMLSTEGLKSPNIAYQQHFMKLFGEIFLYINDIAVFARRSCNIKQIDRVYVGTDIGIVNGMNEYVKSYMGIDAKDFNFGFLPGTKNNDVSQIHIMLALTAQNYIDSAYSDESLNFTMFKRPPALGKRLVGKFLAGVGVATLLALLYPAYQLGFGLYMSVQESLKKSDLNIEGPKANNLKILIESLSTEENKLSGELKIEANILNSRSALLKEIHNKRVKYPMKIVALADLISITNKNQVKIEKAEQLDKSITLSLVSSSEKRITELIEDIANTNRYSIRTREIYRDNTTKSFKSDIVMEIL